jgi:hypothetical protein
MARSRTLKPEFWTDEVIVELSFPSRLFYQGCWNFAICDHGHLDDSPKSLKLKILPADDLDPVALVDELIKHGRLVRKQTSDGRTYLQIPTLAKHTKLDTRWATRCPYCADESSPKPVDTRPEADGLAEARASLGEPAEPRASLGEPTETRPSKGKESKGREGSSASRAKPKHKIPDDFAVSEDMRSWARRHTPLVSTTETAQFVDWHISKGTANADWIAAWRTWMRRAQADVERHGARASPSAPAHGPGHQLFNPADYD